jgi:hypothetical protein
MKILVRLGRWLAKHDHAAEFAFAVQRLVLIACLSVSAILKKIAAKIVVTKTVASAVLVSSCEL